uniref:Fanconi anemia, complementation group F n=1 Tax=Nothobranchius kadleci TaxID=1051664 RepID=A0A1A8CZN5_NOTKA
MEAVLKNVSVTVELLAVAARSNAVSQWDEQTLSRAFHWAKYCEHIYSRFHNNTAIRRVMEQQLQITNQSLRHVFPGYSHVSFSDLRRCQHVLLVGLLNNPELPITIMKTLFKTPVNIINNDFEDVSGICSHLIRCKSACKVLRPLSALSAVGADAEVQGEMLMERLGAMLSQGNELCRVEHFLCSVLQDSEGAVQHMCLVIAAALLTAKGSAEQTASQDFLLEWLQSRHNLLHNLCTMLPSAILKELAKGHQKFRDSFCHMLKKWATEMEYSITEGKWINNSTNTTVTFQKLTEFFLLLFEACPSVRRNTEEEMRLFKISDGDFDVQGLSVWGDLLSELNK